MNPASAALRRVIEQVKAASEAKTAIDIRGGGSKDFYGGTFRGEALEVGEMAGITSYEPTELVITALAGTTLAEVEGVLAHRGQCLPFEPPRFAAGGTLGGMVAAGLAGPARSSAGAVKDFVLGVTVLNGRGEMLTFGGQVMKNVAGYDVSRVFCGSLGILGVICEVSLKVMPTTPARATLCFDMEESVALAQLNRWAGEPLPINASAWHEGRLTLRLAGARAAVAGVRAQLGGQELDAQAADAWWTGIRDHTQAFFRVPADELAAGECLWRLSLPDTAPPLALPGRQFIEWGGAQRWVRSRASATQIRSAAANMGGHATLMRGADKLAGVFTLPSAPVLTVHRRLKQSFDPAGIFNPGRLYNEL
jgi:glycolate oxidase FAD binding subunit